MKFPRYILELRDALERAGFELSNAQVQERIRLIRESRHIDPKIMEADAFILGWLDTKAGR